MIPHFISSLSAELDSERNPWVNPQTLSPILIENYRQAPVHAMKAAVLSILFEKMGEWHVLFIQRSIHKRDKHSGQIGFPGGKLEKGETLEQCALREVHEEIGVNQQELQIIGRLTDLYVSASNFSISPFVAYAKDPLRYILEKDEVAEIIEFPLRKLADPTSIKTKSMLVGKKRLPAVPYFDLNGQTLWGATAILTHELISYSRQFLPIQ